ncbi:DUF6339 family protein [Corallococcus sp. bb12-1]|uniref:DUF6339 family protein n=1 Tax=Corallococcus sp. bb12-1 TaxID=2996784 RepID=UPI002271D560|nr:DUF6339 family protein [Corallococcus sp. bb12-1]MCY1042594.1 DUF6339 family protein [Corallococcus sp. bb12-1]
MPRIYVVREQALKDMEARVLLDDGGQWYRRSGAFEFTPEQLLEFPHDAPNEPPALVVEDSRRGRAAADFEHALQVYDWIGPLSETEARDRRLWVWAAHGPFADYTRARWPLPSEPKKIRNSILEHWFVQGEGRASLRRHSVARLWWAVHLTRAPWEQDDALLPLLNEDPYVYTRLLLGNQDVFFHTLEREFGSDQRILIALLEVVRRSKRAQSPLIKWLSKEVNLACRYRELNLLPIEELIALMESLEALERESSDKG